MYPLWGLSGYMEARNIPTGDKLLGICARVVVLSGDQPTTDDGVAKTTTDVSDAKTKDM